MKLRTLFAVLDFHILKYLRGNVEISFDKPFTVLVGANGSGKVNRLLFMLFMVALRAIVLVIIGFQPAWIQLRRVMVRLIGLYIDTVQISTMDL